jgi:methylenetetrahydrofolate reductase (NADPH)
MDSPGNSALDAARVQAAIAVRQAGVVSVPHLAARRIATAHELNTLLQRLSREAAAVSVFVIAGDLREPAGSLL